MSSHEFSPYQGSECAVGWNIATRMAAYHDVTLLCADGTALEYGLYSRAVADYMKKNGPIPGLRIVYVKQPPETMRYARINKRLMSLTKGYGWQVLFFMGLDRWHQAAFHTASKLGMENFDAVHQLTPISFLKPGYLWTGDKPFFWGPLGGMYKVPKTFASTSGVKAFVLETLRSANIDRLVQTDRFTSIVKKASRIWTVSGNERCIVNAISPDKAVPMIDTSPPVSIKGFVRHYDGEKPLRLCWSGLHSTSKALPLLLHAIVKIDSCENIILDVLGEGPETENWQNMAKDLKLNQITWHGRRPYNEALAIMGRADLFVHTSFREAASMVVLEALGWGLPVICHDACGMGIAVDETCGIKVPFKNPEVSIQGFACALGRVLSNPGLVRELSEGALNRASVLSWDAKVKEMADAYMHYVR
ncbi:MAG: glycosyltransferase family 4 protein [Pseudomonadota bacterium]